MSIEHVWGRRIERGRRVLGAGALCLSLVLGASSAFGADKVKQGQPMAAELQQARAAFSEGQVLLAQERYEEAAARFRVALRVKKTPGVSYHVAFALEKAGRLLEARAEYAETARLLEASPASDVEALLPEANERLDRDTPRLVVEGYPAGATLTLDDAPVELDPEILVDPGEHTLFLEAPGYQRRRVLVLVARGDRTRVDGQLVRLATSAAPPEPSPVAEERGAGLQPAVFWGSVGVATVGLGVGVVGFVLQRSAADRVGSLGELIDEEVPEAERSSACHAPSGQLEARCAELQDAIDEHGTATTTLVVGLSAFAVGTAGALVTHFFWPESSVEWSVAPLPGVERSSWGGALLRVGGTF